MLMDRIAYTPPNLYQGEIMRVTPILATVLTTFCLGCADLPTAPDVNTNVASSPMSPSLKLIASGLANALNDDAMRMQVVIAMRESKYVEHKVLLEQFLTDHPEIMAAAAQATNLSIAQFHDLVHRQHDLDFYVPFRSQRLSWRGTNDYVVGFTSDSDQPTYSAVDAHGIISNRNGHAVPREAVLLIQPAEAKDVRAVLRSRGPALVIQDANDAELGGMVTVRNLATGKVHVVPFQVCDPNSNPDCGTGGGGGGGITYVTFVAAVAYYGDGVGSAEVEWSIHDSYSSTTVRVTGLDPYVTKTVNVQMWAGSFTWVGADNVSVTETDAFSNDDWGSAVYQTADKGGWATSWGPCQTIGDPNTAPSPECQSDPYGTTPTTSFQLNW